MPHKSNPQAAKITLPAAPRPQSKKAGHPFGTIDPKIAEVERRFEALVALNDTVDFEGSCARVEADVIRVLHGVIATHAVGCSTIRRVATLLVRVQRATVAHAEHLVYDVIPACQCAIAEAEAA